LFDDATAVHGEEIHKPRSSSRSVHKNNAPAEDAKEYYKRNVYYPYLDSTISELNRRFSAHTKKCYSLMKLIPKFSPQTEFAVIKDGIAVYAKFWVGGVAAVEAEFLRWQAHWQRCTENDRPDDAICALDAAQKFGTYPCIVILLRILITWPVTTATGDRSFSSLKYIKNYLRSTMGENRLNGLSHLFINRDIACDPVAVIDEFAKKNRRLRFEYE
jgi:hypothetical protein